LTPLIGRYNESQGIESGLWTSTTESFSYPLVAQPGTEWKYSTGFDWAGYLISKLTGISLEEYTQQNIASPLGIEDMTYFPRTKQNISSRMVSMTRRDPSVANGKGKVVPDTELDILGAVKEELGGVGLHASMISYMKILYSLLADDEKLLKKETTAKMFQPQLTPDAQASLQSVFNHIPKGEEGAAPPYIGTFPQVRYDFGLGGMLSMEDVDSGSLKWRRKGYFFWSGMPNIFWVSL
jgi:CubicO group peptidase (beta-lactamase class C family)